MRRLSSILLQSLTNHHPHLIQRSPPSKPPPPLSRFFIRRNLLPSSFSTSTLFLHSQNYQLPPTTTTQPTKTVKDTITKTTKILLPSDANCSGHAYAGQVLAWIDICAGMASWKFSNTVGVTASVDAVHFLQPIELGNIVELTATINCAWKTSMEVGVLVESVNLRTGLRQSCCHAYLTFVSLKDGKPHPVPTLIPETPEEIERYEQAEMRRQERIEERKAAENSLAQSKNPNANSAWLQPTPKISREQLVKDLSGYAVKQQELLKSCVTYGPNDPKPVAYSYTECVEAVLPSHANTLGITFGGQLMKWMQTAAAVAASRHAPSLPLTASVDSLSFVTPTNVGDIIICRSVVVSTSKHSVETYNVVEREEISSGRRYFTNDAYITLVLTDSKKPGDVVPGKIPLKEAPKIIAVSPEEKAWELSAIERRRKRKEQLAELVKID